MERLGEIREITTWEKPPGKVYRWKTPERRKLYMELRDKIPLLEVEALRSIMEDPGAEDFLKGWRFSLENEGAISEKYAKQYVAITGEGVIASSHSNIELMSSLPPEYQEYTEEGKLLIFTQYVSPIGVPTKGSGGISRLSIQPI